MGGSCVSHSHLAGHVSEPTGGNAKLEAKCDKSKDPNMDEEAEIVPSFGKSRVPFGQAWKQGSEPAIEIVIQGLEHEDPGFRHCCLSRLHRVCFKGDSRGVAAACSCFADANPGVRAIAVEAVSHIAYRGDERAIVTLFSRRQDEDPRVRQAVHHGFCGICCQGDERALTAGTKGVNDSDWRVRAAAIDLLGCIGQQHDQRALAAAQSCLNDSDADVKRSALKAVGSLSPPGNKQALEAVSKCMKDRNWRVRQAAVQTLQALHREGDAHVHTMVRQRLRDKDPDVRLAAVHALGEACQEDDESFVTLHRHCSDDPNPKVRAAATQLVIQHSRDSEDSGTSATVPAPPEYKVTGPQPVTISLQQSPTCWNEYPAEGRSCADHQFRAGLAPGDGFADLESNYFIAGPGMMNRRTRVAGDIVKVASVGRNCHRGLDCIHCAGLRRATVLAMSQTCTAGDRRAIATLHQRLTDFDSGVRQAAVDGMGHVFQKGNHTAIDALVQRLGDIDMQVRLAAIASLIKICPKGDVAAIDALTKCSNDTEKPVQLAAIGALGHVWPKGGEDAFTSSLHARLQAEEDPETKQALLRAVVQSNPQDKAVVHSVLRCAQHSDWRVRACAVSAIPEFCPPGDGRGIALARARIQDTDADVRVAAVVVLGQLCSAANHKVVQAIGDRLKDKSWRVRCAAVDALGSVGSSSFDERLLSLVIQQLTDKESEVRQATSHALANFAEYGGTTPVMAVRLAKDGRRQTFL